MSLIGAETCRINAACALGLCVAGLRGQLRKLPFGVSACYAGLSPSRGSSWLGGPVLGTCFPISPQSSRILSVALSTATFVSDVVSTLPPAVAISHAVAAIIDVLPVPVGPQLQGSRMAVGTAPASTPPSATGPDPALPHGGLGRREGFAPRRLRHDSVQRVSILV